MALTSSERQRLAQIDAELTRSSPDWAELFTARDVAQALRRRAMRPVRDAATVTALLVGLAMLISGLVVGMAGLAGIGVMTAAVGAAAGANRLSAARRRDLGKRKEGRPRGWPS